MIAEFLNVSSKFTVVLRDVLSEWKLDNYLNIITISSVLFGISNCLRSYELYQCKTLIKSLPVSPETHENMNLMSPAIKL